MWLFFIDAAGDFACSADWCHISEESPGTAIVPGLFALSGPDFSVPFLSSAGNLPDQPLHPFRAPLLRPLGCVAIDLQREGGGMVARFFPNALESPGPSQRRTGPLCGGPRARDRGWPPEILWSGLLAVA